MGRERRVETYPSALGHPRPMLRRNQWTSLDGEWEFAIDADASWEDPQDVDFTRRIEVPFAPETEASGVHHTEYFRSCWYRRELIAPPIRRRGERLLLHFGAVDYDATVWIDGAFATRHEGGYSPFSVDLTRVAGDEESRHTLVVRAVDDPHDLAKPRGKQDWEEVPHSIWYHRTSGIWQTVWMERVGRIHIEGLTWASDLRRMEVSADVELSASPPAGTRLRVRLRTRDELVVDDVMTVMGSGVRRGFHLDRDGLEELRDDLLWSPDNPALIDAELDLLDPDGTVIDHVYSYTAIREVTCRRGRFLLNNRPVQLRLVLDQGYWEGTGLTPPDDAALRRDVELVKALGFNGVRKHQKIEDPRFLYWADTLGLLVWYECPPAYRFDVTAVRRVTNEWTEAIERDRNHPSIVVWVPFNESTGVLALADRKDQQRFVAGVTSLTKALDPTRPVVSNDGWEAVGGDIIGVHDYEQDPRRLLARWSDDRAAMLRTFGTHGRLQTIGAVPHDTDGRMAPVVLTEFGGIGWDPDAPLADDHPERVDEPGDRLAQPASWGYSTVTSGGELLDRYRALLEAVHAIPELAGFCYTQLADTYQEVNGLLRADRTPKADVDAIASATRGPGTSFYDPMSRPQDG